MREEVTERVYLAVVIVLAIVLLIVAVGALLLTLNSIAIPEFFIAFGATALGALAGMLAKPK